MEISAVNEVFLGLTLGVLLGYIEALNLNWLLERRQVWRDKLDDVLKTTGQLLLVPGFVFAGPWATASPWLTWVTPQNFVSPYAFAFVVVLIFGTHRGWQNAANAAGAQWSRRHA